MGAKRLSQEKIDRILQLAAQGLNRDEIAKEAGVSTGSVSYHLSKPSTLTRVPVDKIREACQQLTSTLEGLKMFQNQGENKENNEKEEKMSNGDVQGKVQEALDRKEMLEKLGEIERLKQQVDQVDKKVGELSGVLGEVRKGLYCDPSGRWCFQTPQELTDFMKKQVEKIEGVEEKLATVGKKIDGIEREASAPKTIKFGEHELGHPDVKEMFKCCDSDDPQSCSTNKLCDQIPASLKAKMLRAFCDNPECQKELDRQGFQLTGKGYDKKYRGMLG